MLKRLKYIFLARSVPEAVLATRRSGLILRARILAALYLSNLAICLFLLLFFVSALIVSDKNFLPGLLATLAVIPLLLLQLYSFYKSGNIEACATFFSMTLFCLVFGGVIVSGGWQSPILLLLLCCPAVAFLVGGRNEGFYMSGLIYFCGLCMMLADHYDFMLVNFVDPEKLLWIRLYIWVIASILLISCLGVYDALLRSLARRQR